MQFHSVFHAGILFFWAGFVCAISFMESWVKFRAKGVSLAIGVSIGSKVFMALNRVEWLFFLGFLLIALLQGIIGKPEVRILTILIFLILAIHTFLLPKLVKRANQIMEGEKPGKTSVHLVYISLEVIKVSLLVLIGIMLM